MSNPDKVRVEFYGDGHIMSVRSAVSRFQAILQTAVNDMTEQGMGAWSFEIAIDMRTCGCDSDIRGHDEYCVQHGDRA